MNVSVYTDGSCDGNPGRGGYAAIIKTGRCFKEVVGSIPYATNNRMELQAVIKGLAEVRPCSDVTVFTDSAYVEQAVNQGRLEVWKENGWRRIRTGEPIRNKTDWLVLLDTIQEKKLNVRFQKLSAHKGHYFNERADFLARQAAKSA